ncbi:MAG: metallophosphoesterase [Christensenellaceae bacterium]|jgi:predicted phosphohydrolase|nr:metallophosphoesterase [Christensenellaceae bacterium]
MEFGRYFVKIFALSDFHLSFEVEGKPMDIFGDGWKDYEKEIEKNWNFIVGKDDIGIIAGDISWAMKMEKTKKDFEFIHRLNGKKIIIRGNHDYWWKSIAQIREFVAPDIFALQNDSIVFGNYVFVGTRGWHTPERRETQTDEDKKIYNREVVRLQLALEDSVRKSYAENIKNPKVVVILHYPPFNSNRDDSDFTRLCETFKVSAVVYGHLHGNFGNALSCEKNGIQYYLSSTDKLKHKPVEIK